MRVRNKTICLLGGIAFMGLLLLGVGRLNAQTLTIKGIVTNVNEAKVDGVIEKDSYLQLVLLGPGGSFPVSTDGRGRFSLPSSLPQTAIPQKGPFSFACKDLKPGKYIVAVQKASLNRPTFLQKDGEPLQIDITEHTGPLVDVGDVTIPLIH